MGGQPAAQMVSMRMILKYVDALRGTEDESPGDSATYHRSLSVNLPIFKACTCISPQGHKGTMAINSPEHTVSNYHSLTRRYWCLSLLCNYSRCL